jgi:hypothetical protein
MYNYSGGGVTVDDMDLINRALAAMDAGEEALQVHDIPLHEAWLNQARQWIYLYEHVGLPESESEEEPEDVDDDHGDHELEPVLNGGVSSTEPGYTSLKWVPTGLDVDDDPDDVARLGP